MMHRLPVHRLTNPRLATRYLTVRHSSGSPTKTSVPADHFTKTGEKPQDPRDQVSRSYEYSQSGGDDMVAQQASSFDASRSNEPGSEKHTAGKGNAVNPLAFSPADEELSRPVSEAWMTRSEVRVEGEGSGFASGRKVKIVEKKGIAFR